MDIPVNIQLGNPFLIKKKSTEINTELTFDFKAELCDVRVNFMCKFRMVGDWLVYKHIHIVYGQ